MPAYRFLTTALFALCSNPIVMAASNMVPNYEVKLLMNPTAVLGTDNKLKPTVLSTFAMPTSVTKMNVQFLDTNAKDIYNAGWSPRIRKMEGGSNFELTYKKRYTVTNDNINAALTTANGEGFDSTTTTYDAQIEWGYQKKTLSISRDKTASDAGYSGTDLPGTSASRSMLISEAPDKFNNWLGNNWGTDSLSVSRIFGPVLAKRSIGTWSGLQFYVEVWPIKNAAGTGTEYIVEASFKTDSSATASAKHDELVTFLTGKGWFLAQDSLKTQLIMDRY
ncbi:uncharacterized protein BDR25DRAFT_381170 [Lindgomyces ingoldianus]|uniref:Uncharacterized protein n=1 Tax=Lindgomyces ingoldianus TaxID=673940 RepID=A0ACB6QBN6_9PLEO|nr:uncharacterized protein BDR25DRAFT_381170 [Lindgomyces ingoldianus]KAF2464383.1 hypothetical protein BDR25DRAFT_381170 [Lindgomyces ingoldianus]